MAKKLFDYAYQDKVKFQKNVTTTVLIVFGLFIVISALMMWGVFSVGVKSTSMEPGIKKGSCLLVTAVVKKANRGDLVLLKPQTQQKLGLIGSLIDNLGGFFTAHKFFPLSHSSLTSRNSCVRRVQAVAGDTIYMQNYILYIKPKGQDQFLTEYEIIQKPYEARIGAAPAGWDTDLGISGDYPETTLKADEYFVLCDNRNVAADSRMWGIIQKQRIAGRVFFCYFPFNKIKIF